MKTIKSMKTIILTTLLILGSSSLIVRANDTINDFLLAAQTDIEHLSLTDLNQQEMNVVSSWIEEAQFRLKSSSENNLGFEDHAETYEIRIKPKAWGQRKIENNLLYLDSSQQQHVYNQLLSVTFKKRYLRLLDYLEIRNKTHHLYNLADLLNQETQLIQSQISSDDFNARKLLNTQEMLQQSKSMAKLNLSRLNAFQSQLNLPLDSADSVRTLSGLDWVIDVSEIERTLVSKSREIYQSAPDIVNSRLKLDMKKAENQLVKTKQQFGVNFLRFDFTETRNNEMAFQLGINIPLGSSFNSLKSHRELSSALAQLENRTLVTNQTLEQMKTEIIWLCEEQSLVQNQIQRVQGHLLSNYSLTSPDLIVNLHKELIEHQKNNADLHQNILRRYVAYLAFSGQLIQQPLRNWIQRGMPELS